MLGTLLPPTPQTAGGEPAWLMLTIGFVLLVGAAAMLLWLLWPRHEAVVRSLRTRVLHTQRHAA